MIVSKTEYSVVIAGGGPTGLMLAGELALAGIDVVVIERRTNHHVDKARAGGLHARTIEMLDQRGIAARFIEAGQVYPVVIYSLIPLTIADFPCRHNYTLGLPQSKFEPILAGWVEELGVTILRGREVMGYTQDASGVDIQLSGNMSLRAEYLVGCDGGRSLVRKAADIDFVGLEPSTSWLVAEVELDEQPEVGMRRDSIGTHGLNRIGDEGLVGLVLTERQLKRERDPSMDELRAALVDVYGTDFGLRNIRWISRFTDTTRQASSYRKGRVLLAGDAAHIHPPHGGQGLNTGVQDAMNLGWKLAQVVNKVSPDSLLDSYTAERHPVGAQVLRSTQVQVLLNSGGERHQSLRDTMTELLGMDEPRRRIAGMLTALDIHYDLGEGHPLLGRRMPDLELQTPDGAKRVYSFLHRAQPVYLNLAEHDSFDISPWADRVQLVHAVYDGIWALPDVGEVIAPKAVLIRPDGYVAWVGDGSSRGIFDALYLWFGGGG